MTNTVFTVFSLCMGLFLAAALLAAIRNPRISDKVLCINIIGSLTSGCIAMLSVWLGESWLLDVCLVYCMMSFLAVAVLAKLRIAEKQHEEDHQHE